ncbi:MAG TPA: cytochrome c biogenesis protein ResB, partial [Pyrinomonadaceae bacterium]
LLLVLSLNIILASIDRFPGAWLYIKRRKLEASRPYILNQKLNATMEVEGTSREEVAARVSRACKAAGLKPTVTEKGGKSYVFAERGAWNRLGAYAVHVALLTTFFGGFLTAQFGRTGQMWLQPGLSAAEMAQVKFSLDETTRVAVPLPFTVTCTDVQQKLIKNEGSLDASNTIDWLTKIRIKDEAGERDGVVQLNRPLDYRGYRFFQASFNPLGSARSITLRLTPQGGGAPFNINIPRGGSAAAPDGTRIDFLDFFPDFKLNGGKPDTASTEYENPAAQLKVTSPAGESKTAYAFAAELPDGAPVGAPVLGYKYRLADFEKAPYAHMLSIQHDPGSTVVYIGFTLLVLTLLAVFLFSHQRVWVLIEEGGDAGRYDVALGGNTNRNKLGFEDRFKRLTQSLSGQATPAQETEE